MGKTFLRKFSPSKLPETQPAASIFYDLRVPEVVHGGFLHTRPMMCIEWDKHRDSP